MPNAPTMLSNSMVVTALLDQKFYAQVPEFTLFQGKLNQMRVDWRRPSGCRGCKQKRVAQNLFREFVTTLRALSPDALARVKGYFGVVEFMLNTVNPQTQQIELTRI